MKLRKFWRKLKIITNTERLLTLLFLIRAWDSWQLESPPIPLRSWVCDWNIENSLATRLWWSWKMMIHVEDQNKPGNITLFCFLIFLRLGESRKLTLVLFWIGCSSCSPMNSPAIMQTLPVKLGILVQFLIFFGSIVSTVTIKRSVVQGSLLRINANLEQF